MRSMSMAEFVTTAQTGKFFTVGFIKRTTQEERVMHCRMGVKKGTKGGSMGYNPEEHHLLPVYDVAKQGFRMVNLEEPLFLHMLGGKFVWDRRTGRWVEAEDAH